MGEPGIGSDFVAQPSPWIPYFADPNDPNKATAAPVGPNVLTKFKTLFAGSGGVFSILWDLPENVSVLCKYGGRPLIARKGYGPSTLTFEEGKRFGELITRFDKKFAVNSTKNLKLNIASMIKKTDWEWFLGDWEFREKTS